MKRIVLLIFSIVLFIPMISYAQYIKKEDRNNSDSTKVIEEPKSTPPKQPTQPQTPTQKKKSNDLSSLSFGERLIYGGNLGLQFGAQTVVDVSPLIGYRITENFNAGIGATYFYYDLDIEVITVGNPSFSQIINISGSTFGGRVYAQYFVYDNQFYLYTEQELMDTEFVRTNDLQTERRLLFNSLVGGGVFLSFGERGGINFSLLYNLNHQEDFSIFGSPFITRVGFMF